MAAGKAACVLSVLATAALLHASDPWQISFFYDKPEQNFDIADIQCPAPGNCIAAGAIEEGGKFNPHAVITSDAGAHWTPVRVSDLPTSLFFLNAKLGWMAAQKGVWQTRDGGQNWKKLTSQRDVRRLFFLDENRGFAAAENGKLLQTTDGGSAWSSIRSVEAELARNPSEVTLEWIFFSDPLHGMTIGEMIPAGANRVPAWMEPPKGRSTRTPSDVVMVGRTVDGGVTWTFSSIPRTDDLINVVFRPPQGVWLVFQPSGVESQSEILQCGWNSNETSVLVRESDALVADAAASGDTILVVAIARQGRLLNLPVPGKLRVYSGPDFEHVQRADVDYRAVARRAQFAGSPGTDVFIATDTGMILRPVRKP